MTSNFFPFRATPSDKHSDVSQKHCGDSVPFHSFLGSGLFARMSRRVKIVEQTRSFKCILNGVALI